MIARTVKRPPGTTLADRLAGARQTAGLTQMDLAFEAGVTQPVISMIEQGQRQGLHASTLFALADVLDVCPIWLYRGEEHEHDRPV